FSRDWSSDVCSSDLLVRDPKAAWGAPSRQYSHYLREQAESLARPDTRESIGWWQTQHAGAPARLELPADRLRSASYARAGGRVKTGRAACRVREEER